MRVKTLFKTNKVVKFHGINLTVPNWVTYLACDKNGILMGYEDDPICCNVEYGRWVPDIDAGYYEKIAKVDLEGLDWTQTLTKV